MNVGFNASHLLTAQIDLPKAQYAKPEQWAAFESQAPRTVERHARSVDEATAGLPLLSSADISISVSRLKGNLRKSKSEKSPRRTSATINPNYFSCNADSRCCKAGSLRWPTSFGRAPCMRDLRDDGEAVFRMVKRDWKEARGWFSPESVLREIVGIVGDVKDRNLADPDPTQVYVPFSRKIPFWSNDAGSAHAWRSGSADRNDS